jgi:hypothetical protein
MAPARGTSFCIGLIGTEHFGQSIADHVSAALMKVLKLDYAAMQSQSIDFSASELQGRYIAGAGLHIDVSRERDLLFLSIPHSRVRISGTLCFNGYLALANKSRVSDSLSSRLHYTFFSDPSDGTPCLMSRGYAFKMITSNSLNHNAR